VTHLTAIVICDQLAIITLVFVAGRGGAVKPLYGLSIEKVGFDQLDLVGLRRLMDHSMGSRDIRVAVIDGPVALDHPAFAGQRVFEIDNALNASCQRQTNIACFHGTAVIGVMAAKRGFGAPAICPDCTFLLRPIFLEGSDEGDVMPAATPDDLAAAITDSVSAGANVINLSASLRQQSSRGDRQIESALDHAAQRAVLVVAAAGNHGTVGSSAITRHPWVVPVVGCDLQGRPMADSNLGSSIGRRGLTAPGEGVGRIGSDGEPGTFHGTSAAAPFVTGTIALLWSEFPDATAAGIKSAVTRAGARGRITIAPPLLDAWGAYRSLSLN
jgi:subtilisin family serine protease